MILQFISVLIFVGIPLATLFGWDSFTLGSTIQRLKLQGPYKNELIPLKDMYNKAWNSTLINLYAVKLRILRLLQFAVAFITLIYIYSGFVSAKFCTDNHISVSDFALKNASNQPEHFKLFMGCAAIIWVLSIFIRSTIVNINISIKNIDNKIEDIKS